MQYAASCKYSVLRKLLQKVAIQTCSRGSRRLKSQLTVLTMPKIRNYEVKIAGKYYTLAINYSARMKSFNFTGIPDEVVMLGEIKHNWAESESALIEELQKGLRRYHEAIESSSVVLMVNFTVSRETGSFVKKTGMGGEYWPRPEFQNKFRSNGHSFSGGEGHGFDISFEKALKKTGRNIQYHRLHTGPDGGDVVGNEASYDENVWIELPFTPERLAFFVAVSEMLRAQAAKIATFLGAPPDELAAIVDQLTPSKMLSPQSEVML